MAIYRNLLRHYLLRLWRQSSGGEWTSRILWGLLGAYIALNFFVVGLVADRIIGALKPDITPIAAVDQLLLALFGLLLIPRLFFQSLPQVQIRPYLHLPLPRSGLVHTFQLLSIANFHNIYPLAALLPFWVVNVLPTHPIPAAICWLLGVLAVLLASHFLAVLVQMASRTRARYTWELLALIGILWAVDQFWGHAWIGALSAALFDGLLTPHGPLLLPALAAGIVAVYGALFAVTRQQFFLDATGERTAAAIKAPPGWLMRLGVYGELIYLELCLIRRNRRTRGMLINLLLFLPLLSFNLIGPIKRDFSGPADLLLAGLVMLFLPSLFNLNYGILMFAWEGRFFDGFITRPINLRQIVTAKLILLLGSALVLTLLPFLPLAFWLPSLLPLQMGMALYCLGVVCPLTLWRAMFNNRPVRLSGSAFSDFSSMNFKAQLPFILLIAVPILCLLPAVLRPYLPAAVGILGMAGLLALPWWIGFLSRCLAQRKHRLAADFRSSRE
jgi:hypothetical protein